MIPALLLPMGMMACLSLMVEIVVNSLGKALILNDKMVYSSIIVTDPLLADILGRDFHRVPQGVNGSAVDNAHSRWANSRELVALLPMQVQTWHSLYTSSCPDKASRGNDRGVMMSHFQIWFDFVHSTRRDPLMKGSLIVVFEDDAVVAVENVTSSLMNEFNNVIDVDLVFLGWCYGRRQMPMCTHAYILSREGAKKMIDNWDICSSVAIDRQWRQLSSEGIISWRKADPRSYSELRPGFEDNPAYFTRGIFTQKKGLVSFNFHGFQNNAG